jgi:serine/threonine protein kinase/tetratricopeptide (TPR) repeat protein
LLPQYQIRGEIGRGGMATVYLAEDRKHHRRVAVKVLGSSHAATLQTGRFLREIEISATLTHPHILPLYDSGGADGFVYFVMPYVDGESLRARLDRERQFPVDEAVRIAREVADALAYAHRHGVVHRDVKPSNVLLEEGHAVVTDFGIATAISEAGDERLTRTGVAVGTPAYMSPEQASGAAEADPRSDQYSLACVVYEMLAGQPPFTAADARAVIARHMVDPVPPLSTVRPGLPEPLETSVARALSKTPADRHPTMEAFSDALAAATAAGATGAFAVSHGRAQTTNGTRSIAVLPFANLGGGPEEDYLSDGITEEISLALSKVERLRVASRTSCFVYKGKSQDVRSIGRELNVDSVLEGSVRRAGNRLRIAARLIDVVDGYQLWSERYDREMEDVFAIQDEMAANIVRALRVVLDERQRKALLRVPTADVRAYEHYLRGRQFLHETRKKSLEYAREMFSRAIEIDPAYALAHAGVADSCSLLAMFYPGNAEDLECAERASQKALELRPDLAEAHSARGAALWQQGSVEAAEREFERAIELDPKLFEAYYFFARARFQEGELEEAARLFEKAAAVQDDYQAVFFAAQSYTALGRAAEAQDGYRRACEAAGKHMELNPDDPRAATMCAVSLCRLGQPERGLDWAARALAIDAEDLGVLYNVACLYSLEGEAEKALDCLEQAVEQGFGNLEWFEHDPDLDPIREHPRFQALMTA